MLPYHSHVDPADVVGGLNRIIEDVNNGRAVFYDFYTDEEKKQQPTKSNTGLFFFRGRPGAPFAVISPGGGFSYVGSVHEGFPYAVAISSRGYNVFVLRYRVGSGGALATRDLAAAITYIVRNAATLGVATEGYSLWGSSAGARMAAAIGSHGVASFGGDNLPKPSAVVMAYTGHSDHSADEPPTSSLSASGTQLPLRPSWHDGSRRYGGRAQKSSSTATATSATASVPVSARLPKDGSTAPPSSGKSSCLRTRSAVPKKG